MQHQHSFVVFKTSLQDRGQRVKSWRWEKEELGMDFVSLAVPREIERKYEVSETWKSESGALGHVGRYLRPCLHGGEKAWIREEKINLKISWGFKGIWGDSSNEKRDTGREGQKGSVQNVGF